MGNINRQPRKYVFDRVVGTTNYQHNRVLWEPTVTSAWCSLVLTMIPVIDWIMTPIPTNVCALILGTSKLYVKDFMNMIELRILRLTRMIQMGSKCKHRQPCQDTEGDYSQKRRGQYAHRGRLERSQAKECWRHQMVGEAPKLSSWSLTQLFLPADAVRAWRLFSLLKFVAWLDATRSPGEMQIGNEKKNSVLTSE